MTNFSENFLSAWWTSVDVLSELGRANPGLIAVPLLVGILVAVGIHYLRAKLWIPYFINGDYRQSSANFCICLGGGVVATIGIIGVFALGSLERAAEGWRERQGASLSAAEMWQLETFQQFFNEVRTSKLEDLSNVPVRCARFLDRNPLKKDQE